jgi:tyrosinase
MLTRIADPIFFLHHGQLDRIWWAWQRKSKDHRKAYTGPSSSISNATASLDDIIPVKGLARDARVSEIMDTEAGVLCYQYDTSTIGGEDL